MEILNNKYFIYLVIGIFLLTYAIYYSRKEKKLDSIYELILKPHKGDTILQLTIEFFSFLLGVTMILFSIYGLIKILFFTQWEKAIIAGVIVFILFIFLGITLSFTFVIMVNHLIIQKKRRVEFRKNQKILIINNEKIDLISPELSINIYEPKKWILKPILYNKSSRKYCNYNKTIEFIFNNKKVLISKMIYIPTELFQLIDNHKNTKVINNHFNWMK